MFSDSHMITSLPQSRKVLVASVLVDVTQMWVWKEQISGHVDITVTQTVVLWTTNQREALYHRSIDGELYIVSVITEACNWYPLSTVHELTTS